MPDVLTHVLVGFIVGMLLAFHYEWIRAPHLTLVMLGALSPDFVKIVLVVPDAAVEAFLNVPFSWQPLHLLGGNLLVLILFALLVAPEYRKRVFLLFALGATSHHVLDLLLLKASGYAYSVLWPLTQYQPPAGMLYRSSDRWPLVVAGVIASSVWLLHRRRRLERTHPSVEITGDP